MKLVAINTIMGASPVDEPKAGRVKPGQVFEIDDTEAETLKAGGFAKDAPAEEVAATKPTKSKAKAEDNAG